MSRASNVVIDQDGVVTPRRGFTNLTYPLPISTERALTMLSYQSKLMSFRTGNILAWYDTASGWQSLSGTYAKPSGALQVSVVEAQSNLYIASSTGIKMIDAYNSIPVSAGMAKGLDSNGTLSGASGFMATNTQVAYRMIWGRKDLNGKLSVGAPSQRLVMSNASGGSRDVSISLTIPSSIIATDFVQVYRSTQSSGSAIEPNDELYLVYE